jgi:hypothetical protein
MSQADIKLLDDVGDAWTRLTNRVQIAGATMLAAAFRTIDALRELKLSLNLGGAAGTGALIGGIADRPGRAGLTQSLEDSLQKGAITPFEAASGKAGKKDTAAEDFIASLKKQADALRVSIKEVTAGAAAAKDYGIELEFAAFKSKLLADNKPIPPDLARQFLAAKNALAELTKELAAAKRESDAVADIAKAFDQDLGEMAVASEQAAREVLKLKDAYDELQKATEKMRLTDLSAALDQDSEEFGRMGEEAARFSEKFRGENFEKDWQAIESVIRSATSAISTAFNGVIQGTQSVGEAFRNMGQSILLSMAAAINEILIVKPLIEGLKQSLQGSSSESSGTGGIFSSILGAIGSALSGALSGSYRASPIFAPIATATGGIFSRPTLRLIGEAGPEAVVPLSKMRGMGGEKQQKPTVIINGNIIPNPGVSREQVVQIVMKDFDNRGPLTHALENRRMR